MFKTLVVLSKITTNKNLGAKGFGKLLSSCQIIHSDLLYYTTPPFHIVVGENWSVAVNYSHIVIGATMVISNLVKHQLSQTVWGWSLSKSLNRFMPRQTTNSAEWQLKRPSLHCSVFSVVNHIPYRFPKWFISMDNLNIRLSKNRPNRAYQQWLLVMMGEQGCHNLLAIFPSNSSCGWFHPNGGWLYQLSYIEQKQQQYIPKTQH